MKWNIGDIRVTRIQEIVFPKFSDVIPAATPEVVKQIKWLFPHFVTEDGHLSLFQCFVTALQSLFFDRF